MHPKPSRASQLLYSRTAAPAALAREQRPASTGPSQRAARPRKPLQRRRRRCRGGRPWGASCGRSACRASRAATTTPPCRRAAGPQEPPRPPPRHVAVIYCCGRVLTRCWTMIPAHVQQLTCRAQVLAWLSLRASVCCAGHEVVTGNVHVFSRWLQSPRRTRIGSRHSALAAASCTWSRTPWDACHAALAEPATSPPAMAPAASPSQIGLPRQGTVEGEAATWRLSASVRDSLVWHH